MIRIALLTVAALSIGMAAAAPPQYSVTEYDDPALVSPALRVAVDGIPTLLVLPPGIPYSSFGWQVGDVNSHGTMIASGLGGGGCCNWEALAFDINDGTLNHPLPAMQLTFFTRFGHDVNENGDFLLGLPFGWFILPNAAGVNPPVVPGSSTYRPSFNNAWTIVADNFYQDASGRYALDSLIVGGVPFSTFVATDINDAGFIAGYGLSKSGRAAAFVLSPVPEPTVGALLMVGLLGLAVLRRWSWPRSTIRNHLSSAAKRD